MNKHNNAEVYRHIAGTLVICIPKTEDPEQFLKKQGFPVRILSLEGSDSCSCSHAHSADNVDVRYRIVGTPTFLR